MRVFSYDKETGLLKGETVADKSPKDDKDVFLVPAFATAIEPPEVASNQRAKWDGSAWQVEQAPVEPETSNDSALPFFVDVAAIRAISCINTFSSMQLDALTDGSASAKVYKEVKLQCVDFLAQVKAASSREQLQTLCSAEWSDLVAGWLRKGTIVVPNTVIAAFDDFAG